MTPEANKRLNLSLTIVASLLLLGSAGVMFQPLLGIKAANNEVLPIYGFFAIFGGEVQIESGGLYAFSFELNIGLLVAMQCFILSAAACFLGRLNRFNRILSLVFGVAGIALISFAVPLVAMTSSLTGNGVGLGWGGILSICFGGAAILIQGFLLVLSLRKK